MTTTDIGDAEDNSIENDAPLDAAAEDNDTNCNSNRSKNDPGKNYCVAFTWKQTVQVAKHLFATAQVFWLALTNLLRVLGCRPSSLHTMKRSSVAAVGQPCFFARLGASTSLEAYFQ